MRSFNSRIIPRMRDLTDRLYIADIDGIAPAQFPSDKQVRTQIDLFRKSADYKDRDVIIYWFSKYVISIAKNYQEQGLPLSDLISEGMLGLIAAIEQFDTSRETKFVTYSNTCISRQIREALDEFNRPVKVPKNIRNHQIKTWDRLHKHGLQGKDITYTLEESSEEEQFFILNPKAYHKKVISNPNPEDEEEFGNSMDDHILLSTQNENKLEEEDLKIDLNRVLTLLTKDEKKVIELIFGIGELGSSKYSNISEQLGIPLVTVNKLKQSGLQKLRAKKSLQILEKYL